MTRTLLSYFIVFALSTTCCAQRVDSTLDNLQRIPHRYLDGIDKKVNRYNNRISTKSEKTLAKLSRWENKIHRLLVKVSPEAADRLFGNNQITFTTLLEKVKKGEMQALSYQASYNKYRDDITTSLKYITQQKELFDSTLIKKAKATSDNMRALADTEDQSEALQQFIKERKKQLIEVAYQHLGKNKYLSKINKEAYYYTETLRNYKEIFSDPKKSEEVVKKILNKIPAFKAFVKQNSMLAGLFDISQQSAQIVPGMQTRTGIQQLIQARLITMGSNGQDVMSKNLQSAQEQLNLIKTKLNSGSSGGEMPDFKPNDQKTKTFSQRIEYGFNLQFVKSNNLIPAGSDIALSIGYKINDKSTIGVGGSYKLGIGDIKHIRFSNNGMGVRSFLDWHLKKQFFISGGFEMNYLYALRNPSQNTQLQYRYGLDPWQKSALIGVMKKLSIKTKWFKSTNVQLLYDFFSNQHIPVSQPIIFRTGYSF